MQQSRRQLDQAARQPAERGGLRQRGLPLLSALCLVTGLGSAASAAEGQLPGELVDRSHLRVCSDPNNLPYSNEAGEGFENKIAELLAAKLGVELTYTWYPASMGFVRNTLAARMCDLIIGVPSTSELTQNTNPYYRSGYVLLQRADAKTKIASLHDQALQQMKIGAVARTPPVTLLAEQGLVGRITPYQLVVDTRFDHPAQQMVEDVAAGSIDVAVVWGPIGGYFAKQAEQALTVTPLIEPGRRDLDFRIAMGLRRGEPEWKSTLNKLLRENRDELEAILQDYGVPLLDNQGKPILPAAAPAEPATREGRLVPEPDGYRMAEYRAPVPATLTGARTVATTELQQLIAAERPLLIDVLPQARKPEGTALWLPPKRADLPGSVWLPNTGHGELTPEFQRYFEDHLKRLTAGDPDRPMVFYCLAECWMSWNAAKRAIALGYRQVIWYPEGTDGWAAAGLPLTVTEPEPMPDFAPAAKPVETAKEPARANG